MTNRFKQSTPPSIHDIYRGLPIGPGGVEPFIYRDRGRHRRAAVHLPWRRMVQALRGFIGWAGRFIGPKRARAVSGSTACSARLPSTRRTCS